MKITYLLGAGASAQVLPLIKDQENKPGLPTRLIEFYERRQVLFRENSDWDVQKMEDYMQIVKLSKKFGTPDLLAKFLLETGQDEQYHFLKQLLSKYFLEVEGLDNETGNTIDKNNIDPRVIQFLTTISSNSCLPQHVKMISWNYDTQIERGARKLKHASGKNEVIENFHSWPHKSIASDRKHLDYFLLHLNGVAGYYYDERSLAAEDEYPFRFKKEDPLLSFAWEDDYMLYGKKTFLENRFKHLEEMILETTILVVIGYSFPFFNRNADRKIFEIIKPTLQKIYYQDPKLDGSFLKSQFNLTDLHTIEWIKDVQQYYVPFEL